MHTRFIIGVVAALGSFALAFEAIGAESPGPNFSTLSRHSGTSSPSREITVRVPDGSSVRVGGKFAVLVQEAYSAYRSKHYDKAISCLTAALQANPDKNVAFAIYSNRASTYSDKGQLDKALSDWTAAIQLNSKSATAWFNRGHDYGVLGDSDKAISDYTAAIRLNPRYLKAYVNRANEYSHKRQYKLAFHDATTAIQLDPKHANTYHNRGAYYGETGDFDRSIADFSEAI
jgi:tetratricopeptide (TPR) repeat protein